MQVTGARAWIDRASKILVVNEKLHRVQHLIDLEVSRQGPKRRTGTNLPDHLIKRESCSGPLHPQISEMGQSLREHPRKRQRISLSHPQVTGQVLCTPSCAQRRSPWSDLQKFLAEQFTLTRRKTHATRPRQSSSNIPLTDCRRMAIRGTWQPRHQCRCNTLHETES